MNPEYEINAQKEIYKMDIQKAETAFKSYIPTGKKIDYSYNDKLDVTTSPARVLKDWGNDDVAEISFHLPNDPEILAKLEKCITFIAAHEISHLFSDVFEQELGVKSPRHEIEEADEKNDILPHEIIFWAYQELIVDLIAILVLLKDKNAETEIAGKYINTIMFGMEDLDNPNTGQHVRDVSLRDLYRFRKGIQFLEEIGAIGNQDTNHILTFINKHINEHVDPKINGPFYNALENTLDQIKEKFKGYLANPDHFSELMEATGD
jgi:hypothetical protein